MTTKSTTIGDELRSKLVARIERGELELPVLPHVAQELLAAAEDPDSDARVVADILHRDVSVAGHLLRLANSPLYAPSVPIVSLQQAVSRLGFARIREVAMTIACSQRLFRVPGHEDHARALFRHSLATGVLAQELARHKRWNVEQAFLTGLLHDVGKPVALQSLIDLEREMLPAVSPEEVRDIADEYHERIAEAMLQSWNFPDVVTFVIGHHHSAEAAAGCDDLMALLCFADELAQHLFGPRDVPEESIRRHPLVELLNLYPEDVDALIALREKIAAALEELR